jgi:hypothetical protein
VQYPKWGIRTIPTLLLLRHPRGQNPARQRRTAVGRRHFESYAELERQMKAARQLRAETLGGATWIVSALAAALGAIRGLLPRITARTSSQA